jgi:Xaa-Pro aminopeptidase
VIEADLAMNDIAFRAVADRFAVGATDFDVLDWCSGALARAAEEPIVYAGNIGLGERGDFFDAQPGGAVAEPGDSLFVDLYCRIGHYVGDSTRCFSAGPAPEWLRAAHGRLERALDALDAEVRPGAVAGAIDRRCRELVDARSAGGVFPHHVGHGVGLRAHEPPYLVPGSRDELRPGDVVCIEPGIYVAGRGGVRLEEVYLVTDDGARALTRSARVLTECPST